MRIRLDGLNTALVKPAPVERLGNVRCVNEACTNSRTALGPTRCWISCPAVARACLAAVALVASVISLALADGVKAAPLEGIHKIQHVVMIMQENRTLDTYFGTYPGANGIPSGVCMPDPMFGGCVAPYHNSRDENRGGPHGNKAAVKDLAGGKMDGFIASAEEGEACSTVNPACGHCITSVEKCNDVMVLR
jgi:Phosphoesterase family